jgi:hypothetical protein
MVRDDMDFYLLTYLYRTPIFFSLYYWYTAWAYQRPLGMAEQAKVWVGM